MPSAAASQTVARFFVIAAAGTSKCEERTPGYRSLLASYGTILNRTPATETHSFWFLKLRLS